MVTSSLISTICEDRMANKHGTDHLENLQLLCNYCNSLKGNRSQEYRIAEIARRYAV